METVQKELISFLKQNKELKELVDKHKRVVEQATSMAGDAKKELDEMLKRMNALEHKVK